MNRMLMFRCGNGHVFEAYENSEAVVSECKCGGQGVRMRIAEAPRVKSSERLVPGEVKQYLAQFGEVDPKTKKWKYIPANKGELDAELKRLGKTKISEREFNDHIDKTETRRTDALAAKPSAAKEDSTLAVMKARREWFRSAHDSGFKASEGHDDSSFWKSQGIKPPAAADKVSKSDVKTSEE